MSTLKKFIIQLFLLFSIISTAYAGQLLNYGFEDWNGSIQNTPQYIFSNAYSEYADRHQNASEVVTSYNGWTPHSGNYMWLQNDGGYSLSPSVSGITSGTVNAHNNIGYNGAYGGSNDLKISNDIQTGEIFIRFWARNNGGFGTIDGGGRCKWIRIYTNGGTYDTVYMHLATSNGTNSTMYFYCGNEGSWLGGGVALPGAFDGNWHKYAMYVNWNNGTIRGWYDVSNETSSNATKEWVAGDGRIGAGTRPDFFVIQGNFSAKSPTERTYHALDDVEVWDGMPSLSSPSPVDNAPSISINTPTTQTTYETDQETLTFQGTASDDNGIASISWSYGNNQQGTINSNFSNWSTGAVSLTEGTNQFTITITDSGGNTASDTVSVTYNPDIEKASPTGLRFGMMDSQYTALPSS
jgi:hypothetical protein